MIKVGDHVQYIGDQHKRCPEFYPECGTMGVVKYVGCYDAFVQWPAGSTSGDDCWSSCLEHLIKEGE